MTVFSHADRDEVKARAQADFLGLFEDFGGRRRGKALLCLFHEDGTPSASIHNGRFHCFACGLSLDVFEFVARVQHTDFKGALSFLANRYVVPLERGEPLSAVDRQRYAHARQAASAMASDIEHWRDAFTIELNKRKIAATEAGDLEALGPAAELCRALESGSPEEIAREFIRHRAANPKDTERLINAGRERDLEAQRITAECVLLLARAAEQEGLNAAA